MDIDLGAHDLTALSRFVSDECERRLRAYEAQPRDASEHFETENEVLSGGYAYRQLYELVQNAADAILDLRSLLKLSLSEHSETACRLTNLFFNPRPVQHVSTFLEEGLIHRTTRGELVRSKSEVIIANLLHALGITYAYEQPFTGKDGSVRYPDFTIEDAETGRRVFLEHLGLLSEPAYLRRWLAKLDWYRSQGGITGR